jgi:uncharacterized protein (TIGR02001 family)
VTARAEAAARRARGSRTSLIRVAIALLAGASAAPASAEIGLAASVFSDARFRGYSLSEGRPVGTFDFAYDDASGFYAGLSVSGVLRRGGKPAPFALQGDAGYAKRLASGTTIDLGVTHSTYSHYSSGERGTSLTEIYGGISRGVLSSRLSLSPHYFEPGRWTAYTEVNAVVSPASSWSLDGHAGMLVTLRSPSGETYRPDFDWSVGVTRALGRVSLHARWSDGAPGHDFYNNRRHSRSALVLGASLAL